MDKTIGTFNRLLSVERYAVSSVRATREGQNLETSQRNLLKSLREQGKSGNLPLIVAVEKTIVEAERAYYANSRAMDASLKTALQELDVVQKHIGIVDDPVRYKAVDEVYSLPRSRKGGLPNDEARQALRSHHARLNNMDKARLGDVETMASRYQQSVSTTRYRGVASEGPCRRETPFLLVFPDLPGQRVIPPA